jgi:hypothetical protein
MKTLSLLLILAIGCLCNRSYAQSALEPCPPEFLADYYLGVDKIIDDAVGRPARLALTTLPSFHAESGVRLVGTDVYLVRFDSFFWAEANSFDEKSGRGRTDFSKPRIKTKVHSAALSPEIANRVEQTYAAAIANAKKSDRLGLDGVSYRFSTPQTGCGEAWSPDPGTANARLVELSELLAKHAQLSKLRHMQRSEQSIVQLLRTMSGR